MEVRRIAFFYTNYYPVNGGSSVHGFNLAKNLSLLEYTLIKINGVKDPFTRKYAYNIFGFLKAISSADLVYIRMDHLPKIRNIILLFCKIFGKKVIVEFNAPSDELIIKGYPSIYIKIVELIFKIYLRLPDSIIVISEPLEKYFCDHLKLKKVYVIENGGERFNQEDLLNKFSEDNLKVEYFRNIHKYLFVWSGSADQMQDLKFVSDLIRCNNSDFGFFIIIRGKISSTLRSGISSEHTMLFENPARDIVEKLISLSDFGLAFYQKYLWSRWGFYNSSLKIYEYAVNGLFIFTNAESFKSTMYTNVIYVSTPDECLQFIYKFKKYRNDNPLTRTWNDVALETKKIIEQIN